MYSCTEFVFDVSWALYRVDVNILLVAQTDKCNWSYRKEKQLFELNVVRSSELTKQSLKFIDVAYDHWVILIP
jgi:hypothetical protein